MASKIDVKRFKIEAEITVLENDVEMLRADLSAITFLPLQPVILNMIAAKRVKIKRLQQQLNSIKQS